MLFKFRYFIKKLILLIFFQINLINAQDLLIEKQSIDNFTSWNSKCSSINETETFITSDQFLKISCEFFNTMENIINENNWVSMPKNFNLVKNEFEESLTKFKSKFDTPVIHRFRDSLFKYVQKLILPKNGKVIIVGDIHGIYQTLSNLIDEWIKKGYIDKNLKIKENIYIVFLGDYKDRGPFGFEVTTTLMQLKIINPKQLILVRGNHEHYYYNEDYIINRFPNKYYSIISMLNAFLETLPDVLYIGFKAVNNKTIKYFQLNHGGMEKRYNPEILISKESNFNAEELPLEFTNFKWHYIIEKNREEEINRYIWFGMEMKETHNNNILEYIKNNLKKDYNFEVIGIINGHNHEAPKKNSLCNMFPDKVLDINLSKEKELLQKYPNECRTTTPGYCNLGTQEIPIIITIAGPMRSALPTKENCQHFELSLNYNYTYVLLETNENDWQYKYCVV
ncbi:metallophosphoesterase [Candidatus Dependentiae bacterium]|nr:metallophosphoesterase [Candidatus Dependentiae bacterium]MBU4387678.1 metallophosphoesterase [Candidatus Dependentiae bacterium]MCG2756618.1 metallophosphoesterase [Candidatus Dependentiae bacterium]